MRIYGHCDDTGELSFEMCMVDIWSDIITVDDDFRTWW